MSKEQHTDSTPEEKSPHSTTLSAHEVLAEAARNGDTTAVREGPEKLSPGTESKPVALDAVHEACRESHDKCLALLLPFVETTQMGFGILLSECVHADHTACTEVLLRHWKSVCSKVDFVPHGQSEGDSEGLTPRACPGMWADPAVCQVLIDAGADIEAKDDIRRSPLHWACRSAALAVVKMLVKAGAEVCATDNDGHTCLTTASYFGHTETVRYLASLKDVDVNHKAVDDFSALHYAVDQKHPNVEVLIDAGADIESKSNLSRSPLLLACTNEEIVVVKMLVKAGAEVCATDNEGDTCLTLAACTGEPEIVRYLVGLKDVDVNHKADDHFSALHYAVDEKHPNVVEVLIDAGADIETKDDKECSPLHLACTNEEIAIVKMLVKAGAQVCVKDNKGDTCLTLAAYNGHTEIVRYLVGLKDVDVNHKAEDHFSALYCAVDREHPDVVEVLIDAGADIETKDDKGCSPLLLASCSGALALVKMLVKAGAEVCATDNEGHTCLTLAAYNGHTEIVRYLVGLKDVDVNHKAVDDFSALHMQ